MMKGMSQEIQKARAVMESFKLEYFYTWTMQMIVHELIHFIF